MYKTETHLHTFDVSECSSISAQDMVRIYKNLGYKTIFISDHLYPFMFDKLTDMSWDEKIDLFLKGYYSAKEEGDRIGVNVLLSAEIEFREHNCNHYLAYGIDCEFLKKYPDIIEMGIEKFSKLAKEHNILLIQAHPYRDGVNVPMPEYVDGIEVVNPNPRHENFDDKCFELALKNNLLVTSGSDAHHMSDVGRGGVETDEEITTPDDYIRLVKEKKIRLIKDVGDKNDIFAQ